MPRVLAGARVHGNALGCTAVRVKFLSRASHVRSLGLHSMGTPLTYNTFVVSVTSITAQLFPSDSCMLSARRPCTLCPPPLRRTSRSWGPQDLRRMAWVCWLRAVLRCPGLAFSIFRVDAVHAAIAEDRCLVPRFREWLAVSTIADWRTASSHALGLPQAIRENAKPQALIVKTLAEEIGDPRLREIVARWMARLLGEPAFPPQAGVVIERLRVAFTHSLRSRIHLT